MVQEFALVCKEENIRDRFEESFVLWCRAIASYCKETQIKSSVIQAETRDYCEDLNDGECASYINVLTSHSVAAIVLN